MRAQRAFNPASPRFLSKSPYPSPQLVSCDDTAPFTRVTVEFKALCHPESVTHEPTIGSRVSDLWIVPIFLDFWRLFGRSRLGLSACDSDNCAVLGIVGMGVAKTRHVSVHRIFASYGILLMPPKNSEACKKGSRR